MVSLYGILSEGLNLGFELYRRAGSWLISRYEEDH
jgi:hypothetical protein